MKKIYSILATLLLIPHLLKGQENTSIDQQIDTWFGELTAPIVNTVFYEIPIGEAGLPIVLIILILGALYFTVYFGFVNIRHFITAIKVVWGSYDDLEKEKKIQIDDQNFPSVDGDNPDTIKIEREKEGEVSHFQALTAALSATVGLGNIAGVAIALSIGGPGATFWMILAGFIGMSSKFTECTLGVKYREIEESDEIEIVVIDGKEVAKKKTIVYGGPMYYLSKGLEEKGLGFLGKILAVFFAIMCVGGSFGGGNMFQINQAFKLFEHVTGGTESFIYGNGWIFGLVMAILVGIVIIGGIKSISKVTEKIVPFMVGIYVFGAIAILVINASEIPAAFGAIINGAFTPIGITGGFVGVLIQGFKRSAFSNEAGIGSASIAHSAVETSYPASEGLVALLEPFIDTVIVCTMTALVIIITGSLTVGQEMTFAEGVLLTSSAFESDILFAPYVLTLAVILFAFSSMISWSYYGYQAWAYLFGRSKTLEYAYKFIFCVFVVIGAAASLNSVMGFSDAMIFAMLFPNMIGLFLLAPVVKKEFNTYLEAIRNYQTNKK